MKTKSDDKKKTSVKKQPAEGAAEKARQAEIDARIEEKIDRDLADSFPASDPPGWTMGVRKRRVKKDKA